MIDDKGEQGSPPQDEVLSEQPSRRRLDFQLPTFDDEMKNLSASLFEEAEDEQPPFRLLKPPEGLGLRAQRDWRRANIVIFDKTRPIAVPDIPEDTSILLSHLNDNETQLPGMLVYIRHLREFLNKSAITDSFGNNNEAREDWRNTFQGNDKQIFEEAYVFSNQLRGNNLGQVTMAINFMARAAENSGNEDLRRGMALTSGALNYMRFGEDGYRYDRSSIEEKITTVRAFENVSAQVLTQLLGKPPEEQPSQMVT